MDEQPCAIRADRCMLGVTAATIALLLAWLWPRGYGIEYVIPADFTGVFAIRESAAQYVDPTVEYEDGLRTYVYVVRPDGVLWVKTFAPFEAFHKETARIPMAN